MNIYKKQTIELTFAAAAEKVSRVCSDTDFRMVASVDFVRKILTALGFSNES